MKNYNSKLISCLFVNKVFHHRSNNYGNFVLDTELMNNINIPRVIDKDVAFNELKILKYIFDRFNIVFFLTHGSCLGAVREKDFISHDHDLDIGCYKDDLDKIILAVHELEEEYKFKILKLSLDDESIAIIKNNVILDISLFKTDGVNWQSNKDKIFTIPYIFLETLNEIEFLGIKLNVPNNTKDYFIYQYGIDWDTSIRNFYCPYRKKIELPIKKLLSFIFGVKIALKIAQKVSKLVKYCMLWTKSRSKSI